MPSDNINAFLRTQLDDLKAKGLYKAERRIESPQKSGITVNGREVVNFCANNYLGLANHPDIVAAAHEGLKAWGYGLSQRALHLRHAGRSQAAANSRSRSSSARATASSTSPASTPTAGCSSRCSTEQDAIISDELNHASIIDGVRLCKAQRFRYKHNDMADLKAKLEEAKGCRFKMIFTDSVFCMDGDLAKLPDICALADQYDAAVGIDDCHATGHLGATGRGAAEELGVLDRIDVITGTLGKTLGGASGGFTAASAEIVDWLRNRSRPYLFSNSVPPALVVAGMKALELVDTAADLRTKLKANTKKLRAGLEGAGFTDEARPDADPAGDARRRGGRDEDGRRAAEARHLRDRLQLPGGAAGPGPHPHPGLRGAHRRATRPRDRGVHRGREASGSDLK